MSEVFEKRLSGRKSRSRGQASVEFALLLVIQLFFFLMVVQFVIIAVADSVNTYSGHVAARANAVHRSPFLAATIWNSRVYRAPRWRIPPLVRREGRHTVVSTQYIPLEMPGVARALSPTRTLALRARTTIYREARYDRGDNRTLDGY